MEITQPSSRLDFLQLSNLIVNTFDNPLSSLYHEADVYNFGGKEARKNIGWSEEDQKETVKHTMNEYLQNAKKMQGYKYALWIAKEYNESPMYGKDEGNVIGVVEVGLTQAKPNVSQHQLSNSARMDNSWKRPTIGVLCVDPAYRSMGIASALIETCESLITQVWNEANVYVQVEPWNIKSLNFFEKQGYQLLHQKLSRDNKSSNPCIEDQEEEEEEESTNISKRSHNDWKNIDPSNIILVKLYRNRELREIPHVLLVKKLLT